LSLGKKLKDLRLRNGESLQQVADIVKVSKAHIWELEKGTSKNPSVDLLGRLADHFKVRVASLVGENPEEGEDEDAVVMYRDIKGLEERDRQYIQDAIDLLKKRMSDKENPDEN